MFLVIQSYGGGTGIYLYSSYSNNIYNNTIFLSDWFGIRLFFCSNNYVISNKISQCNGTAITLRYSHKNNISKNEASFNEYGINLYYSNSNNITENNVSWNNEYGIYLEDSPSNQIYHNNIINNANQANDDTNNGNQWNNSYPYGGNYWSDYTGEDKFKGPNQDIPGKDGIGDVPYIIDSDSQDNYPLMLPWEDYLKLDKNPPSTTHDYDSLWHTSDFAIILIAVDDLSGINETYYRINDGPQKMVSTDGYPLITTESSNSTLEYWSIDNASNEESHNFLYNIKLDKTAPSTGDDYDDLWHYLDFMINLTASDELSGINDTFYKINNGDIKSVIVDGQPLITSESENNTLEYWSTDLAGNIEGHHFAYGIKLNKTYPDFIVSPEDITFSGPRLIEDSEVYLNATIHNIGYLSASAKIKFYDGEPNIGLLIGSITISVAAHNSNLASVLWNTTLGNHNIYVLIENSIPEEPFKGNNVANKSVIVEVPPVLVLSVGDINVFRFESGEERTVPVYVSSYNNSAINVRLVILDDRGLNITVVTPPQNISKDGSFTFYLRIKAPILKEEQEYREEDILLQVISDETTSNEEYMDIIVGRAAAELFWWFVLLGGASAGAGTLGFLGGTEIGKYALFAATMSLYTRLTRKDVEDQETRGMIRGYILANPGEHYNAIKRALGLKNGNLAYHLKKLEKESLIKSARDGRYKRFYPPGMEIPEDVFTLNKIQEIILGEIVNKPGISQKKISEIVGLSTSTINYHISVMTNSGFVRIERKGKLTMCYPGNGVA